MSTTLNLNTFDRFVEAAGRRVCVILCSTTWCGPCKTVKPQFESLREQYSDCVFGKFDTDACIQLTKRFGISSIPCFLLFYGGKEATRVQGANIGEVHCRIQELLKDRPGILHKGDKVRLKSLAKEEYNGHVAEVVDYDTTKDRYVIKLSEKGEVLSIGSDKCIQVASVSVERDGEVKQLEIHGIDRDRLLLRDGTIMEFYDVEEAILQPGMLVVIDNLQNAPHYNGLKGRIESHRGLFSGDRRYLVTVEDGKQLKLRPGNVRPIGGSF